MKRLKSSLRLLVAVMLFVVAGFTSLFTTAGEAVAKRAVKKNSKTIKGKKAIKDNFRLLNIYKNAAKTAPKLAAKFNNATEGKASWYGGFFNGRKTASGSIFNTQELTAAHRTLPFGTMIRVTNVENNQSVVVEVSDRGPYVNDRILDLSKAAATKLGYAEDGVGHVKMTVLGDSAEYANAHKAKADSAANLAQFASANHSASSFDIMSLFSYMPITQALFEALPQISNELANSLMAFVTGEDTAPNAA